MNYELFNKIVIGIATIALSFTAIVYLVYFLGIGTIWAWVYKEASPITAAATVVLAFTSIVATFYGLSTYFKEIKKTSDEKEAKYKHDRVAVQPLLRFKSVDTEDKQNVSIRNFKIVISNKGIGPAFIKEFIMYFNDEKVKDNSYYNFLMKKLEAFDNRIVHHMVSGSIIKAGEEIVFISFEYDSHNKRSDFISKLDLFVEYQSIYKDSSMYSSHLKSIQREFDPPPNPLAKEMAFIHADCFTKPNRWSEQVFAKHLQAPKIFWTIQPRDVPNPCGFALGYWLDDTRTELLMISVYTYEHSKGYGRDLLNDCIAGIKARGGKSIFLEVAENNAPALHLFKKVGFKRIGLRPAYYKVSNEPSIDAIAMRLDIKP